MKIKNILATVCLGMLLLGTAYAENWTTDTTNNDSVHDVSGAECTVGGEVLCNTDGDCAAPATLNAAVPTTSTLTATTASGAAALAVPSGGWVYNVYGTNTCSGTANWVCYANPTFKNTDHVMTECTGAGTTARATLSGTTTGCTSGYANCDATATNCEIQIGSTNYPTGANNNYTSACTAQCDSNYLDCDASGAGVGNGCEIQKNSTDSDGYGGQARLNTHFGSTCAAFTCDSGYFVRTGESSGTEGCTGVVNESCTVTATGLPGECTGAGSTGTASGGGSCACAVLDIPEFAGGGSVNASGDYTNAPLTFSTSTGLIVGDQTGSGSYVQFGDDADANDLLEGAEIQFEIDGTGSITAGFIGDANLKTDIANDGKVLGVNASGIPVWIAPGDLTVTGDNLGDHIATQSIDLGTFSLVGNSGTAGLSIAADGDATFAGTITSGGTTYPSVAGTDGYYLTTNSGVASWASVPVGYTDSDVGTYLSSTYPNLDTDGTDDTETLDEAYDNGTDAASRTVTVDAEAVKFTGSHASNNVFELAQTAGSGTTFDIVNSGTGNALRINDGTADALIVDVDGNTTLKQLNLVAAAADAGTRKPTASCDGTTVGNIAYATEGGSGAYYGCKETTTGNYSWTALEVFGA